MKLNREKRENKIPDLSDEENGIQELDNKQNIQRLPITISRYRITDENVTQDLREKQELLKSISRYNIT